MTDQTIEWLRGLAAKGGKGVVDNIDARCLGRIADSLEKMARRIMVLETVIYECCVPTDDLNQMIIDGIAEKRHAA